jgi:hypothetical protein
MKKFRGGNDVCKGKGGCNPFYCPGRGLLANVSGLKHVYPSSKKNTGNADHDDLVWKTCIYCGCCDGYRML